MKKQNITRITIEYDQAMHYVKEGSQWIESFTFEKFSDKEMRTMVKGAMNRGIEVSYE